jgi:hypothetical protein
MSVNTVPHVRASGNSSRRPALRLVPTPTPPTRRPYYPTDNAFGAYLRVLSRSALQLYGYLKQHANRRVEPEYCDRGYDTLARDLRLSRRMAIYAERELEAYGWLTRHAWQGRYQGKRANRYTFPTPTGQPQDVPKPWRLKRPSLAGEMRDQRLPKSAMDCTCAPPADDKLQVQSIACVKVQRVAPIQEEKHKSRAIEEGESRQLDADEAPTDINISTAETTTDTSVSEWRSPTLTGRAREVFDLWQTIAEPAGLPRETYTPDLERAMIAGLRTYGASRLWHQAVHDMARTPYFTSPKARGWEDSLHWLVTKDHVYRVINGHYQHRGQASDQPRRHQCQRHLPPTNLNGTTRSGVTRMAFAIANACRITSLTARVRSS